MSRTVTALYDTRAEAEAARERLSAAVVVEGKARIIDKSSTGSNDRNDFHRVPLSHEDRHAYGEGLRRGGFMLCAEVDDDEDTDKLVSILEETSSVDLDDRQNTWRNEGWTPYQASSGPAPSGGSFAASGATPSTQGSSTAAGNVVEEQHIPIVEEQLVVGKREVNRGGARIRTYVRETPVHEEVSLREEHVSVERRPVNERLRAGDLKGGDAFEERSIEMTETAEEAVVAKEARVREELVVRKTAEEHVENIDETVRRTEVEVDEGFREAGDRSAFGGFGNNSTGSASSSESEFERTDRDKGL